MSSLKFFADRVPKIAEKNFLLCALEIKELFITVHFLHTITSGFMCQSGDSSTMALTASPPTGNNFRLRASP